MIWSAVGKIAPRGLFPGGSKKWPITEGQYSSLLWLFINGSIVCSYYHPSSGSTPGSVGVAPAFAVGNLPAACCDNNSTNGRNSSADITNVDARTPVTPWDMAIIQKNSQTSKFSMTSAVVFYSVVPFAVWRHERTNLNRFKTGSNVSLSVCVNRKSNLVWFSYDSGFSVVSLVVWGTKVQGWEILRETGARRPVQAAIVVVFWPLEIIEATAPFFSVWFFLALSDYLETISCFFQALIGFVYPIWAIRKSKIAETSPVCWTPCEWMGLHQTEPFCTTRAAHMRSRKPLIEN